MATAFLIDGVGRYDTLKVANANAVAKGDILVNVNAARVVVAMDTYLAAAIGLYAYEGRIQGPKAAVTIAAGDTAYWDPTAHLFTNISAAGANTKCGIWYESAASGDALGYLDLENTPNL